MTVKFKEVPNEDIIKCYIDEDIVGGITAIHPEGLEKQYVFYPDSRRSWLTELDLAAIRDHVRELNVRMRSKTCPTC